MPTPSSDQPTGTSSPPPYALPTSTCPDDLQQSDRSVHSVTVVDGDLHHEPLADSPASSTFLHPHTQYGRLPGDVVMLGAATPAEPSSRATTMSPGPQSGGTNITSPIQGGAEAETESLKMTHNLDSDCHWGGENSSATGDLPRHREALSNRTGDTLDNITLEDSHCVPRIGPDYPIMRVCFIHNSDQFFFFCFFCIYYHVTLPRWLATTKLVFHRQCQYLLPLTYVLEAAFMGLNNQRGRSTRCKWKSSMSTCGNPSCAAICAFKV